MKIATVELHKMDERKMVVSFYFCFNCLFNLFDSFDSFDLIEILNLTKQNNHQFNNSTSINSLSKQSI